ncbi:MAG TPA: hypothetical protein VM366_14620 [Anaerolineae bacterium]|nr:hypothetical protein [Anaerolineae bacterium]
MAHVTLMAICDGIAATFHGQMVVLNAGVAAVPIIAQSYDELTEGMHDTPTLQVYPQSGITDYTTENDRMTFKGKVKGTEYEFLVMAFARPRSQVGEDMEACVRLWDAVETILEDITCDYFGIAEVGNIAWTFGPLFEVEYGGQVYRGFQLVITVRFF